MYHISTNLKKPGIRIWWTWIICLGLCLTVFLPAAGADSAPVEMTVQLGFDNKCRLGGINPVTVTLATANGPYSGWLRVTTGAAEYRCPVEIGAGARKELRFSLPFFKANQTVEAVFEQNGQVLAQAVQSPDVFSERTVMIGVLSDSPGQLGWLTDVDMKESGGGKTEVIDLGRSLKYSREELENFNFIVIEDFPTASLTKQESGLLEEWIQRGNCILVGAGDRSGKTLTGICDGLVEAQPLGEGMIIPVPAGLLNNDPQTIQGILTHYITPYALNKGIHGTGLAGRIKGITNYTGVADYALKPGTEFLYFMVSLLALYMISVVVSIFTAGRLPWLYAGLVVFFSILFLILPSHNGLNQPACAGAAVRVYGPPTHTYTLTCLHPFSAEGVSVADPAASFTWLLGDSAAVIDAFSGELTCNTQNTFYTYTQTTEMSSVESISLSVDDAGRISGRLTNPLPEQLEHCFVIFGDTSIPVGSLDGKESVAVDYRLNHNLQGSGDYNYLASLHSAAGMQDIRRQLIDYYFYNIDDLKPGGRLIGFSTVTKPVEVDGRSQPVRYSVMHVFAVDIPGRNQPIILPAETIRSIADRGTDGTGNENGVKRELPGKPGGEARIYYVMPPNLEPLDISVTGILPPGGRNRITVYNRSREAWEDLDENRLIGERVQSLVDSGPLLLQVTGDYRSSLPQIAVRGRVR